MKTILVTGGCGYLGSQLIRDLARNEHTQRATIRIMDNLQSGSLRGLMDLPPDGNYQFLEGDILDPAAVRLALQNVDTVVHLAGLVRTPLSFENPAWLEQVNHWGTASLVEAALEAGVARFIYTSSTAVYGPGGPYTEEDPCRPQGPYARSKHEAERSISAATGRGLQAVTLRLATLFGLSPVTRFEAVFNRFAYLAGVGRPLTIYGDGRQRRPFVHVRDASQAILLALTRSEEMAGHVANVVAGSVSVRDSVAAVKRHRPQIRVRHTEQDIRTHFSFEVSESLLSRGGWEPRVGLVDGLGEIVDRFGSFSPVFSLQETDFE